MKTYRLEIVKFDDAEQRRELYQLACDCQHIVNRIWQLWEAWHVSNDSRRKLIAHLEADRAWREEKIGERPKWPVDCLPRLEGTKGSKGKPQSLRSVIEADIKETFPHVHSRVRTLLANITFKNITDAKSAAGSLKGWIAILLNHQSRPSSTRPVPIPFDGQHSKVLPGESSDANAVLYVRLDRNTEKARTVAEYQRFDLNTTGRASRYVKPITRIAGGEWQYKGSSLYYDATKKKWFALITCEMPPAAKVEAVPGSVAILRFGYGHPIQLRINGRRRFLRDFGRGDVVGTVRRQLLTQRWGRKRNYRVAGGANKGHGRKRALGPVFLLSRRWKDFTKRYNHTLTTALVQLCLAEGVERIVLVSPRGPRYLSEAGKVDKVNDSTGWPFYQVETFLKYKGERHGIQIEVAAKGAKRKRKSRSA